jgi:hypothetical protein
MINTDLAKYKDLAKHSTHESVVRNNMKPQPEYNLSITGKTSIEKPLEVDKSYAITFREVSVYGKDDRSGHGESDQITFKSNSTGQVLISDGKDLIEGKPKKGSQSQKTRLYIMRRYNEMFSGMIDDDKFYDLFQGLIRYKIERGDFDSELLNLIDQTKK